MSHFLPPGAYLPHQPPMLLLEQVMDVSADSACCQVQISPEGVLAPFLNDDGSLPGWYALELIAQTVGVWSGWHREQRGDSHSTLGMVLGARELTCASDRFPAGATLTITVHCLMQDARLASFDGQIHRDDQTLARGRVNTFQPGEAELKTLFQQGGAS